MAPPPPLGNPVSGPHGGEMASWRQLSTITLSGAS